MVGADSAPYSTHPNATMDTARLSQVAAPDLTPAQGSFYTNLPIIRAITKIWPQFFHKQCA
jgi:hypothetical protein